MLRKFFILFLFFCLFSFQGLEAQQEVSFEAIVSAQEVIVGNRIQLSLVLQGAQDADQIQLPSLNGAQVQYVGPSSQVSVINGVYDIKKTFHYHITPFKEGKLVIPSVEVKVKGQTYQTQSIVIDVLPVGSKIEGKNTQEEDYSNKIFLKSQVNHNNVYRGEYVLVSSKLYVRQGFSLKDVSYPSFITAEGMEVTGNFQPQKTVEKISGESFDVYEFVSVVVPRRLGSVVLGPVVMDILIPAQNTSSYQSPMDSFLTDGIFSDFFSSHSRHQQIRLTAESFQLKVNDLPLAGQDSSFSGAIGQFQMDVSLSSSSVKLGDPLTLKMTIKGLGDLSSVTPKLPLMKGFKAYDPVIKKEKSDLILEQVLIPTDAEIQEIPAIPFSYFDPIQEQYQKITQGPFPIDIQPLSEEEKNQIQSLPQSNGSSVSTSTEETYGKDIVFIRDDLGIVMSNQDGFFEKWWLQFLSFLYGLLIFLIGIFLHQKHYVQDNQSLISRLESPEKAREALKSLSLKQMSDKEMATKIRHIIENLFVIIFRLPPGEISTLKMMELLSGKVPEEYIDKLIQVLDICSAICFASGSFLDSQKSSIIKDLIDVIAVIERRCL